MVDNYRTTYANPLRGPSQNPIPFKTSYTKGYGDGAYVEGGGLYKVLDTGEVTENAIDAGYSLASSAHAVYEQEHNYDFMKDPHYIGQRALVVKHEATIRVLRGDIDALNAEIVNLNNAIDERGVEINRLDAEIVNLNNAINDRNAEIDRLNAEIEELNDIIDERDVTIRNRNAEIIVLRNSINERGDEITRLAQELADMTANRNLRNDQLVNLVAVRNDLNNQLGVARVNLATAQGELVIAQGEIDQIKGQRDGFQQRVDELTVTDADQKRQLDAFALTNGQKDAEINALRIRITALEGANAEHRREVAALKLSDTNKTDRIRELTASDGLKGNRVTALEAINAQQVEEITRLGKQLAELEARCLADIGEQRRQNGDLDRMLRQSEETVVNLEKRDKTRVQANRELETKLQRANEENAAINEDRNRLTKDLTDARNAKIEGVPIANQKLVDDLKRATESNTKLAQEKQQLTHENEDLQRQYDDNDEQHIDKWNDLVERYEKLAKEYGDVRDRLKECEKNQSNKPAQHIGGAANDPYETLLEENKNLGNQIGKLEDDLKVARNEVELTRNNIGGQRDTISRNVEELKKELEVCIKRNDELEKLLKNKENEIKLLEDSNNGHGRDTKKLKEEIKDLEDKLQEVHESILNSSKSSDNTNNDNEMDDCDEVREANRLLKESNRDLISNNEKLKESEREKIEKIDDLEDEVLRLRIKNNVKPLEKLPELSTGVDTSNLVDAKGAIRIEQTVKIQPITVYEKENRLIKRINNIIVCIDKIFKHLRDSKLSISSFIQESIPLEAKSLFVESFFVVTKNTPAIKDAKYLNYNNRSYVKRNALFLMDLTTIATYINKAKVYERMKNKPITVDIDEVKQLSKKLQRLAIRIQRDTGVTEDKLNKFERFSDVRNYLNNIYITDAPNMWTVNFLDGEVVRSVNGKITDFLDERRRPNPIVLRNDKVLRLDFKILQYYMTLHAKSIENLKTPFDTCLVSRLFSRGSMYSIEYNSIILRMILFNFCMYQSDGAPFDFITDFENNTLENVIDGAINMPPITEISLEMTNADTSNVSNLEGGDQS